MVVQEAAAMGFLLDLKANPFPYSTIAGLLLFLLLPLFPSENFSTFAQAPQHPKYRLQERKNPQGQVDRLEGIKPVEIAGERLDLVAVLLNTPYVPGEQPGQIYRLGLFLPETESRVSIEVRDYNVFHGQYHYWMLPTRKQYNRGFQEFAWDATLARELNIRLEDLGAVAWVGGYGYHVVAPMLLHTAPFPPQMPVQGCRFLFIPSETMTVAYRLYSKNEQSRIFLESTAEKWHKDEKQTISWKGQNLQGDPAPEGQYVLELTAEIASPGRSGIRIPYDYVFYYKPDMVQ
jgi:hypothetical protein